MTGQHWENLKELFHAALTLSLAERRADLDSASIDDASLHQADDSRL